MQIRKLGMNNTHVYSNEVSFFKRGFKRRKRWSKEERWWERVEWCCCFEKKPRLWYHIKLQTITSLLIFIRIIKYNYIKSWAILSLIDHKRLNPTQTITHKITRSLSLQILLGLLRVLCVVLCIKSKYWKIP